MWRKTCHLVCVSANNSVHSQCTHLIKCNRMTDIHASLLPACCQAWLRRNTLHERTSDCALRVVHVWIHVFPLASRRASEITCQPQKPAVMIHIFLHPPNETREQKEPADNMVKGCCSGYFPKPHIYCKDLQLLSVKWFVLLSNTTKLIRFESKSSPQAGQRLHSRSGGVSAICSSWFTVENGWLNIWGPLSFLCYLLLLGGFTCHWLCPAGQTISLTDSGVESGSSLGPESLLWQRSSPPPRGSSPQLACGRLTTSAAARRQEIWSNLNYRKKNAQKYLSERLTPLYITEMWNHIWSTLVVLLMLMLQLCFVFHETSQAILASSFIHVR